MDDAYSQLLGSESCKFWELLSVMFSVSGDQCTGRKWALQAASCALLCINQNRDWITHLSSVNFYKLSLHVGDWQLFFIYYLVALSFMKTLQQFEWFSSQDSLLQDRPAVAKSSISPVRCANLGCAWDPKSFVCSYLSAFFKEVKQCLSHWMWSRLAMLLTVK